jgi:hypothetical protein
VDRKRRDAWRRPAASAAACGSVVSGWNSNDKVQLLFPTGPKVTLTIPLRVTIGELKRCATKARPDLMHRHMLFRCQFPYNVLFLGHFFSRNRFYELEIEMVK